MITELIIPDIDRLFPDFLEQFNFYNNDDKEIFLSAHEVNELAINFIKKYDQINLSYNISAILNFNLQFSKITFDPVWFKKIMLFHKLNNHLISELKPYNIKEYYFDILLGSIQISEKEIRENKFFVREFILKNNLEKNNILRYVNYEGEKNLSDQDKKNFEIGFSLKNNILKNKKLSFDIINFNGVNIQISNIIPIEIYNKSVYSVIAETRYSNEYTFFTEKTVKPLIGQRMFIAFCGQFYLRNLKSLGFKTFEDIIDESYDNFSDQQQRWKLAGEQILHVMKKPQEEIIEKIKPITEFNYNHLKKNFLKFGKYFTK